MTGAEGTFFTAPIGTALPIDTGSEGQPVTIAEEGVTSWSPIGVGRITTTEEA